MPKKKKPKPEVKSAAPGYGSSAAYGAPQGGVSAPGGPYGPPASASPAANGASGYGPPPPQAPRNPFVTAQFLWQFGKPISATIQGMRPAVGGNNKFGDRKGWFLDLLLENGTAATGRINEGDQRHQRLWAAFADKPLGRKIILRLPNPGDMTKALWTLDAA
jgi:hypothetical protein